MMREHTTQDTATPNNTARIGSVGVVASLTVLGVESWGGSWMVARLWGSPSICRWGNARSSHLGSHQVILAARTMSAGTSRQRTMVASTNTAVARPTPNSLVIASGARKMNDENTTHMMAAADVTTDPVSARPRLTAVTMLPVLAQCSWKAVSRNTS